MEGVLTPMQTIYTSQNSTFSEAFFKFLKKVFLPPAANIKGSN